MNLKTISKTQTLLNFPQIGLVWLFHQRTVTVPIIGPGTLDQLSGTIRAIELTLSNDLLQKLDIIISGPSGPAPEAYAW